MPTVHIHLQEYFHAASAAYEDAATAYASEQEEVADIRAALHGLRDRMEDLESELVVNGGVNNDFITASTAEKRKAQTRLILSRWPDYQQLRKDASKLERDLAQAESRRDAAANQMSLNKRRMEAHTANVERQSAILNARGTETRNYSGK